MVQKKVWTYLWIEQSYLGWYMGRVSVDMSTDISLEGCTNYMWSNIFFVFNVSHQKKFWKIILKIAQWLIVSKMWKCQGSTIKFVTWAQARTSTTRDIHLIDIKMLTEKVDCCKPTDNKSYTESYQNHKCCSFGYKLVCQIDGRYTKQVKMYRGDNAIGN